jgi:predicted phosphodiesterase
MKIQVVSDLHLEFSDINIQNEKGADVLILSGDIMVAHDLHEHPETSYGMYSNVNLADLGRRQQTALRFRDFLKRVSFQFPHVIYVAGNHEFYHGKWYQTLQVLRNECAKFDNIYFFEDNHKVIDDITFVGGTLWTDMNRADPLTLHAAKDMLNDFRLIRNEQKGYTTVKPADTVYRHRDTMNYIEGIVSEDATKKYVVVGHHTPSLLSCHEQYKNDHLMNGCYHSDLSNFILDHPQIKLWTHGHTHNVFDYTIGETRVVCNPRGYENSTYSEQSGWDQNFIVEI